MTKAAAHGDYVATIHFLCHYLIPRMPIVASLVAMALVSQNLTIYFDPPYSRHDAQKIVIPSTICANHIDKYVQ